MALQQSETVQESRRAECSAIDRMPRELLLQIFSYLAPTGLFHLKLAGSRYLTTVLNSLGRPSFFNYLQELQSANPGCHPIHIAATRGHEALLIALFKDHSTDMLWNGKSKLHWAADIGRNQTVKQLLLDGAPSDSQDLSMRTPLHWAAVNGHEETVKLLLESRTLLWAVKHGQKARYIEEHSSRKVVGFDRARKTPLYLAAEKGHLETVRLLLKNGDRGPDRANMLSKSPRFTRQKNALDLAAENGHMEVVRLLLKSPDIRRHSSTRYSVVMKALYGTAKNGQIATAKLLLEELASLNASRILRSGKSEDLGGPETVIAAVEGGHKEMVKLLLERKMITVPKTALKAAAEKRRVEILGILLDCGLNQRWIYGEEEKLALRWAASNGEAEMVKLLMTRGNVTYEEAVDRHGRTPLHCAAFAGIDETWYETAYNLDPRGYSYGHKQVVEYLLSRGEVNVEQKDCSWMTALHYAASGDKQLSDASGPQSGVREEIIKLLLDSGADRRAKDWNNRMPVHWAAANGNMEIFSLVLHQQSDIDARDQNGRTPLHYAIDGFRPNWNPYGRGRPSMVKFLLDQGADKDAQDENGRTPMHVAAWDGFEEIFYLLQDRGASASIKDKNGDTAPLILARWREDEIDRANKAVWYSHHGEGGSGGIGGGNG